MSLSLIVVSLSLKKVIKQKAWLDLSLKVSSLSLFEFENSRLVPSLRLAVPLF